MFSKTEIDALDGFLQEHRNELATAGCNDYEFTDKQLADTQFIDDYHAYVVEYHDADFERPTKDNAYTSDFMVLGYLRFKLTRHA